MSKAYFPFYWGDWRKDTAVLTLEARGAWIDLIGAMNEWGVWFIEKTMESFRQFFGCESTDTVMSIIRQLAVENVADVEWSITCDDGAVINNLSTAEFDEFWQNLEKANAKLIKAKVSCRKIRKAIEKSQRIHAARVQNGQKGGRGNKAKKVLSESKSESNKNYKNNSRRQNGVDDPELQLVPEEPEPERFSVQDLVDSWNGYFDGKLSKVTWPLSDSRHRKASARIREHDSLDFWKQVFRNIRESSFLMGADGLWRCTLDFVIANDSNCVKIWEGQYGTKDRK